MVAFAPAEETAFSITRSAISFERAYPVGDAEVKSWIDASGITTFESWERVAMAVPTEEQNRSRAGFENGEDRERSIKFCSDASCGVNDCTGKAKFTAHAQ